MSEENISLVPLLHLMKIRLDTHIQITQVNLRPVVEGGCPPSTLDVLPLKKSTSVNLFTVIMLRLME